MGQIDYASLVQNATPGGSGPIPVGEYEAVVSGAEFKTSSNGNPMFNVEFTITDESEAKGRKAWRNIVITEKSVNMALDQLLKLGTTQGDVAAALAEGAEQEQAIVCGQLVDSPCRIKIKHREWEGKTQNDVDRIMQVGNGAVFPAVVSPVAPSSSSRPSAPF